MSTSDAVEMTAQDIIPRLNKDTVTDLVLVSMLALPDSLPSHFHDTYTPIAAAGGQAQVVHLARLLATQMNAAKVGKGYERMEALRKVLFGVLTRFSLHSALVQNKSQFFFFVTF